MTRCASPSLFAGIASFLSARTGGRFRLIIGFEAPENQDSARDGAAIIEAAGGHALLMPRALPAPLTAFSVRMVMADGAVYVCASGEALIYLGGRAIDRSREGALAPDAELALIDEAVAALGSVRGVGVRRVLRALALERVRVDADVCRDIDTPEDVAWWQDFLGN